MSRIALISFAVLAATFLILDTWVAVNGTMQDCDGIRPNVKYCRGTR